MSTDDSAEVPGAQRSETVPAKRSVSEVLGDQEHKSYVAYVVGLFTVVGIGFGLTGSAGVRMLFETGSAAGEFEMMFAGLFAFSVFAVMFFTGPVLGTIAGLEVDRRVSDAREAAITAFAGSALGYVVMNVVGVFVTVLLFPSTGSSSGGSSGGGSNPFELGDVLVPLFVMAVPVGVVAAGVVYVRDRYLA